MSTTDKEFMLNALTSYFNAVKAKIESGSDAALREDLLKPDGTGLLRYTALNSIITRTLTDKLDEIVTGGDYQTPQLAANSSFNKVFFVPEKTEIKILVPTQISNLADAIDAIGLWTIPITSTVTIDVAEGDHYGTRPVVISHPFAERLVVNGPNMSRTSLVTGIVSVSGSIGNYLVRLGVSTTNTIKVGSWLYMRDAAGTGPYKIFNGCYKVTAVDATTVTIRIRLWTDSFPAITLTGGSIYRYKAVIHATNCDGLIVKSSSPTVNNLLFAGNMWDYWDRNNIMGTEKGTHGVYVGSNTIIDGTGKPGGENPYGISGGSLSGIFLGAVDFDQQGFTTAGSSSIFGQYFVTSSCGRRGFYVGTASGMEVKFSVSSTHYLDAIISDYGGVFNTSYFEGNGCRLAGAFSNNGGRIVAPNSHFWFNIVANIDIRAGGFGGFDNGSSRYSLGDGAHYEYGASGSLMGSEVSDNEMDGVSGYYSAGVRLLRTRVIGNKRFGCNIFCSDINIAEAIVQGNLVDDFNVEGPSGVFDGLNFKPIRRHPAFMGLELVDNSGAHSLDFALNTIGDFNIVINDEPKFGLKADGTIVPLVEGATLGRAENRYKATYSYEYVVGRNGIKICTGTGNPEGYVPAPVGSTYHREDGGPGTTFYVKESGVSTSGWVAK